MAVLDWMFIGVLALSLLLGAWRGLVYEVLSLLGWLAAFVVAQLFAPQLAAFLPAGQAPASLRYAGAFVLLFIAAAFVAGVLAWGVRRLIAQSALRPVDRTLGAVFGVARGLVLLLALAVVVHLTAQKDAPWWNESLSAGVTTAALKGLKPALPTEFGRYLPD